MANKLIENQIVVDTIMVSDKTSSKNYCFALSKLTGGFLFFPSSIEEGVRIFSQESFLDLNSRINPVPAKLPITEEKFEEESNNNREKVQADQAEAKRKLNESVSLLKDRARVRCQALTASEMTKKAFSINRDLYRASMISLFLAIRSCGLITGKLLALLSKTLKISSPLSSVKL